MSLPGTTLLFPPSLTVRQAAMIMREALKDRAYRATPLGLEVARYGTMSASEPDGESPDGSYLPDDLCAHGCGNEATIQHADLRFLCALCYSTELTSGVSASDCPTCGEHRETP